MELLIRLGLQKRHEGQGARGAKGAVYDDILGRRGLEGVDVRAGDAVGIAEVDRGWSRENERGGGRGWC